MCVCWAAGGGNASAIGMKGYSDEGTQQQGKGKDHVNKNGRTFRLRSLGMYANYCVPLLGLPGLRAALSWINLDEQVRGVQPETHDDLILRTCVDILPYTGQVKKTKENEIGRQGKLVTAHACHSFEKSIGQKHTRSWQCCW